MPITAIKNSEFGGCYLDISKTERRLIKSTLKTYEKTGTYVFLNLYKKFNDEYDSDTNVQYFCCTDKLIGLQLFFSRKTIQENI